MGFGNKLAVADAREAEVKTAVETLLRNGGATGYVSWRGINYMVRTVDEQRYATAGDWIPGDPVTIPVLKLGKVEFEMLLAIHEMSEYERCKKNGITDEVAMHFDIVFEKERERKLHGKYDEPGNDPRCPYYNEHVQAEIDERMAARMLEVNWDEYTRAVNFALNAIGLDGKHRHYAVFIERLKTHLQKRKL